jgi:FMN phosphatase YigB (HAD superfamily)
MLPKRSTILLKNSLCIGDSWTNDIVWSMEAGWQSIWFNHRKRKPVTDHKPLEEIEELLTILPIIKSPSINL